MRGKNRLREHVCFIKTVSVDRAEVGTEDKLITVLLVNCLHVCPARSCSSHPVN